MTDEAGEFRQGRGRYYVRDGISIQTPLYFLELFTLEELDILLGPISPKCSITETA